MRQIETEFHFFCECPAYNEQCGIYLNNYLLGISNTFSFHRLMSSKNERAILGSARFLYFAFEERKLFYHSNNLESDASLSKRELNLLVLHA